MLDAAISCTIAWVDSISGMVEVIALPTSSEIFRPILARDTISLAADLLLSASFFTSSATTAKPLP
jgi:hypothetical protein